MAFTEKKKRIMKERLFIFSLLIVPITAFFVFWLYINVSTIFLGFFNIKDGGYQFTLEHFSRFFKSLKQPDDILTESLLNTFKLFGMSMFVMLPLTLVIAYFLYKQVFGYKVFRYVFFLPSIISAVVMTTIFKNFVAPEGPLNLLLSAVRGKEIRIDFLADSRYALGTVMAYGIWTGLSANMILMNSAMARIPADVFEAAKLDGIKPAQEIVKIVLPLIWPTISTLIILSVAGIFTAGGVVLLLTGGTARTYTMPFWFYTQVTGFNLVEYASAVGLIITLASSVLLFGAKRLTGLIKDVEY
jgi:ABC-type sugar transport system permease subunit